VLGLADWWIDEGDNDDYDPTGDDDCWYGPLSTWLDFWLVVLWGDMLLYLVNDRFWGDNYWVYLNGDYYCCEVLPLDNIDLVEGEGTRRASGDY